MFSRYAKGQEYGLHADNAVMSDSDGWPFRTDVSFTLFLSDPETYVGGALLISDLAGEREYRPEAGRIVFKNGPVDFSGIRNRYIKEHRGWSDSPQEDFLTFREASRIAYLAKGTIVGTNASYDLAVVKVDRRGLPTVPLGDSALVRVGDVAIAIGAPLGLDGARH
jgi:hypothetical protein